MSTNEKILKDVLSGFRDKNIKFSDLQKVLENFDFQYRIVGDHFIYYKDNIPEIINIQPDGNKAKAYQVKQIRNIIFKYKLEVQNEQI